MTTLEKQLTSCTLSKQCKSDLRHHIYEVEAESIKLPKIAVTQSDAELPTAVTTNTLNFSRKYSLDKRKKENESTAGRYLTQKHEKAELLATLATSASTNGTYFKKCSRKYHDQEKTRDPFPESRNRTEISGRDMDFVYRYAEALTKAKLERPQPVSDADVTATDAYITAFRSYTGREPTAQDLEEVGRLHFGFNELGDVGVVSKPHSCYPHIHISGYRTHPTRCRNQVYMPEVPAVKAARRQFPGPIPTNTHTKYSSTVASNGMYQPGHVQPATLKRNAVDTVVGSK